MDENAYHILFLNDVKKKTFFKFNEWNCFIFEKMVLLMNQVKSYAQHIKNDDASPKAGKSISRKTDFQMV